MNIWWNNLFTDWTGQLHAMYVPWCQGVSCRPRWPQTHCVAKNNLEILTLQPLPLDWWDSRHVAPHQIFLSPQQCDHALEVTVQRHQRPADSVCLGGSLISNGYISFSYRLQTLACLPFRHHQGTACPVVWTGEFWRCGLLHAHCNSEPAVRSRKECVSPGTSITKGRELKGRWDRKGTKCTDLWTNVDIKHNGGPRNSIRFISEAQGWDSAIWNA